MKLGSVLLWSAVGALGALCVGVVAFSRGEPVNALWLIIAALCTFAVAYRFHSAWLVAKVLTLDDQRATPARVHEDGRDFVRTHKWIVLGHHFAAIAGPGPLVGPVLAAQFGYLPGALWILIGATLGGGVHDAVVMFCSIRRSGKSLGQMVREEIGHFTGMVALVSILAIMVILIAVLGLVVVKALAESPWGVFTIAMTMPIALLMGSALRFVCPNRVGLVTGLGVVALLLSVWGGKHLNAVPGLTELLTLKETTLAWWIIGYGFAASALPVWLLLAPRDYLSTFMKIGTVALLALALIVLAPPLHMPALTKFVDGSGLVFAGPVFPFCFITIACAAVSGFHALISSGTTPKLLDRESDIRVVGYGAMVTEMVVGIMALVAACSLEPGVYFAINTKGPSPEAVVERVTRESGFPVTVAQMDALAHELGEKTMIGRAGGAPTFAVGMAHTFAKVLKGEGAMALWYHFAIMFEALFILTTIDAGTRVGRFLLEDVLAQCRIPVRQRGGAFGAVLTSALFVGAWGWFLYSGVVDPKGGINSLWPIFGIANQLLAVIALALGTTVLIKMGRQRYAWVTLLPLTWLMAVTVTAAVMKIFSPDPRLGFLAQAAKATGRDLVNCYVNTAVTGAFLLGVLVIVLSCAREWVLLLTRRKPVVLRESEYVTVTS